jgi:sugar lactone lactonase YvrE
MAELQTLLTGLVFGESPRWHDGRLWFSDMGANQVGAVDLEGNSESSPASRPCRWAPAGFPMGAC